ncbi:hypothetical protein OCU04_013083 [Sclerotinia nivalis]|uniref:Uncharacterized protein n=1 Tax=Sclerotinia nivalis TaxID=352851 RepID=A0A9X0DC30_9HELO|nr:hypothetical protein OCU04_013083 [Sclerotinia nivalis]
MKQPPGPFDRTDIIGHQVDQDIHQGVQRFAAGNGQGQAENQGEAAQGQDANQDNTTQEATQEPDSTPGQWQCKLPYPFPRMHQLCDHVNEAGAEYCTSPVDFKEPGPWGLGHTEGCGRPKTAGLFEDPPKRTEPWDVHIYTDKYCELVNGDDEHVLRFVHLQDGRRVTAPTVDA